MQQTYFDREKSFRDLLRYGQFGTKISRGETRRVPSSRFTSLNSVRLSTRNRVDLSIRTEIFYGSRSTVCDDASDVGRELVNRVGVTLTAGVIPRIGVQSRTTRPRGWLLFRAKDSQTGKDSEVDLACTRENTPEDSGGRRIESDRSRNPDSHHPQLPILPTLFQTSITLSRPCPTISPLQPGTSPNSLRLTHHPKRLPLHPQRSHPTWT